jgi:hypothetical protein
MSRKQRGVLFLLAGLAVVAAGAYAAISMNPDDRQVGPSADAGATAPGTTSGTTAASSAAVPSAATTSPRTPDATAVTTGPPTGGSPAGGKNVPVALTYVDWDPTAGRVEASGFVPEVVEVGGRCTLSLTKGNLHVDATSTAEPDATSTSCGLLAITGDKVEAGTWTATVGYRSTKSQGTSAPMSVAVPAR